MPDSIKKTVAIHQPNFFPWLGYFLKIAKVDTFVFLDDVEINEEGYTRRTKIRKNINGDEKRWLTVPLKSHGHTCQINDLIIEVSDWQREHLAILKNAYRHAPFYEDALTVVETCFSKTKETSGLSTLNISLIQELIRLLGLDLEFVRSSDLPVSGTADEYTFNIARFLGAQTYVRGKGEAQYASSACWKQGKIELLDLDSTKVLNGVEGLQGHFLGTSILDALFTVGFDRIADCLKMADSNEIGR